MHQVRAIQVVSSQFCMFAVSFHCSCHIHVCSVVVHNRCLILINQQLVVHFRHMFVHPDSTFLGCHNFVFLIVLLSSTEVIRFFSTLRVFSGDLPSLVSISFFNTVSIQSATHREEYTIFAGGLKQGPAAKKKTSPRGS